MRNTRSVVVLIDGPLYRGRIHYEGIDTAIKECLFRQIPLVLCVSEGPTGKSAVGDLYRQRAIDHGLQEIVVIQLVDATLTNYGNHCVEWGRKQALPVEEFVVVAQWHQLLPVLVSLRLCLGREPSFCRLTPVPVMSHFAEGLQKLPLDIALFRDLICYP